MKSFNKSVIIFLFLLSILFGTTFILYYINISKIQYVELSEKSLKQEAIAHFQNMIDTRIWNAEHGGIYVKANSSLELNKYLKDNHTFTKDNELLIKINPAWMTRQISEIANKNGKYYYKITSLNPINPNNKADAFETEALNYFKTNKNEKYYTRIEDNSFNFMGSLEVKRACLECHAEQDYVLGDVRGGLRVTIPIDNYNEKIMLIKSNSLSLTAAVIFIALFISVVVVYFINSIYKRQETIELLNTNLEDKIKNRTEELEASVKKLNELATIDFLTKIPNRRYFFELGNKLFSLAKRDKTELSLIIIDVDFFKKINDEYGHFIGDEVLKVVSQTIQNTIRSSDLVARIGGEEFIVLLNETSCDGAYIIAEKLRKIVEEENYTSEAFDISITISMGISCLNNKDDNELDDILIRADEALYSSKRNGRNRVSISKA
ncbi:diguanylate cyclase [Arcobacter sp. LA11]|uniref:diguanylate cyclase n=1 Tax=Arcobacter sp. LA11 TaxID=1898176 RepID=UPI00093232D5|nr:diguanylate cyclase [Arcobacter sp. LA11]